VPAFAERVDVGAARGESRVTVDAGPGTRPPQQRWQAVSSLTQGEQVKSQVSQVYSQV
jgi:hypothetical protein